MKLTGKCLQPIETIARFDVQQGAIRDPIYEFPGFPPNGNFLFSDGDCRDYPPSASNGLPRMADFAIWASACESAFWSAGTFMRAYEANRRSAIEGVIDADPVASCIRDIMTARSAWAGTARGCIPVGTAAGAGA